MVCVFGLSKLVSSFPTQQLLASLLDSPKTGWIMPLTSHDQRSKSPSDFCISKSSPQLFNTPQDPPKQRPLRASSCCSSRKFSRVISLAASWLSECSRCFLRSIGNRFGWDSSKKWTRCFCDIWYMYSYIILYNINSDRCWVIFVLAVVTSLIFIRAIVSRKIPPWPRRPCDWVWSNEMHDSTPLASTLSDHKDQHPKTHNKNGRVICNSSSGSLTYFCFWGVL